MANTLSKKELINALYEKLDVTKSVATEAVNTLLDIIAEELKKGNKIDLKGFGKFEVKERSARTGINPLTKEAIKIPATKAPTFKASKGLKELVK